MEKEITFIMVFAIIFDCIFYYMLIRIFISIFRRNKIDRQFKNNVVRHNIHENKDSDLSMSIRKDKKNIYVDVDKDMLEMFNTDDIDSLKDYFYDIFYRFETAYNNLDYNAMRLLTTKQLYQNYYTGISLNLKIGKKKIINDLERKKVIIYELDSTVAKQTLSAMIEVSYITYTLNSKGYVISGSKDKKVTERFEVTFRKDFEKNEITKCPNCGANIVGNKCDYCRTTIKTEEFRISDIKRIID